MRTATNDGIKFTYPDEGVWSAERQIIYLERESGSVSAVTLSKRKQGVIPWVDEDIATYKLDANGKCAIDITDLVRTFGVYQSAIDTNTSLYLTLTLTTSARLSFYLRIAGLIDPEKVVHPYFDMPFSEILPPERILYNGKADIISECYITSFFSQWSLGNNAIWVDSTTKRQVAAIGDFDVLFGVTARRSTFENIGGGYLNKCDTPTALVRWVSFTGVQRVHVFKLRKSTVASANNYQLLTMDNSYNEIKGREDSFALIIDNLSPYDFWYYSDVVTSSKVEVSLDGYEWNQVQVTNKNATTPDGTMTNGKLEITVNWRKYDAVTM